MKKQLLLISAVALFGFNVAVRAQQSWRYNFGTNAGVALRGTAKTVVSTSATNPAVLMPAPAVGQTVRLRTGNGVGNSGYDLVTSGTSFGSGARLKMTATTTSSSNKFSMLGIPNSKQMAMSFNIRLGEGSVSYHRFAIGADPGTLDASDVGTTQFSNNLNFGGATLPTFLIMQWNCSSTGNYTFRIQKKDKSDLFLDPTLNPGISFVKDGEYKMQIYANNATTSSTYYKDTTDDGVDNSTTYTVTSGSYHIWVNGIQLIFAAGNPNFTTAELPVDRDLNAFMFLSVNPTNPAVADETVAYIDDLLYTNYITDLVALPIQLTDFKAVSQGNSVKLNWATATEINNSHFELMRSSDGKDFKSIATVKGGGNTQTEQLYTHTDQNPLNGTSYYQLRQVDFDGASSLSKIVVVKSLNVKNELNIVAKPSQQVIELAFFADKAGVANVKILDLSGKKVLEKNVNVNQGNQTVKLPFSLPKGLYIGNLQKDGILSNQKFVF